MIYGVGNKSIMVHLKEQNILNEKVSTQSILIVINFLKKKKIVKNIIFLKLTGSPIVHE